MKRKLKDIKKKLKDLIKNLDLESEFESNNFEEYSYCEEILHDHTSDKTILVLSNEE